MRRPSPPILALLLLAAIPIPAAAFFAPPSVSVERQTQAAMSVLHVRVVTDRADGPNSRVYHVDVLERLKGDAPPRDLSSHDDTRRLADGEYVLFLLARRPDGNDASTWTIPRDAAIPLTDVASVPTFRPGPLTVQQLLDLIRNETMRPAAPSQAICNWTVYPLDDRFYEMAYRFLDSPNYGERLTGLAALRPLNRPQDHDRVRRLLTDPATCADGQGRAFHYVFPVRDAAAAALGECGDSLGHVAVVDPEYHPVPRAHVAVALAPPLGALVALFLLRDRRRPHTLGTRLCGALAAACVLVAVFATAMWLRSLWRVDQVILERDGHEYELSSTPRGIQLLRLEPIDPPRGAGRRLVRTSFPPGTDRDQLWRIDVLFPAGAWRFLGRVPYPLLIAATAGEFVLLRLLASRLRLHRFRTRNLCPACGYDLRAAAGRCPECGWAIPVV